MTIAHVLVTNILRTGTAFGVLAGNHAESVFLPARLAGERKLVIGQTVRALIVPNQSHQERTPWIAVQLEPDVASPQRSALGDQIILELDEGSATLDEIADAVSQPTGTVARELQDLVARGDVTSYVVFDLPFPAP